MIQHEQEYLEFIQERGVGDNDEVASSPLSYISYLNSVSRIIGKDIGPDLLHSDADVGKVVRECKGEREQATIQNYATAMRHYVAMVREKQLLHSPLSVVDTSHVDVIAESDIVFIPNHTGKGGDPQARLNSFLLCCKKGKAGDWSCKKSASPGDLYLFWFGDHKMEIVGVGVCQGRVEREKNKGVDWTKSPKHWFRCPFDPVRKLTHPITLDQIHDDRSLAAWWQSKPFKGRPKSIKPDKVAQRLLSLIVEFNPRLRPLLSKYRDVPGDRRPTINAMVKKYGPGGEGQDHKDMKEFIATHPETLNLTNVISTKVEHPFKSSDVADIVFTHTSGRSTVVEIETDTPLPGAHQIIKYRALLCAQNGLPLDSEKVKGVLVAWSVPQEVQGFCKMYHIRWREHKLSADR